MGDTKKPAKPLSKKDMKKTKGGSANSGGSGKKGGQENYYKIEIKDAFITG